jgi:hypothetical protein
VTRVLCDSGVTTGERLSQAELLWAAQNDPENLEKPTTKTVWTWAKARQCVRDKEEECVRERRHG